jgi:hypothetical protein
VEKHLLRISERQEEQHEWPQRGKSLGCGRGGKEEGGRED